MDYVVWAAGLGEEGLGEGFGQRAAGDGDFEDFVSLDAGVLCVQDVGSEGWGEGGGGGEGEEVGLFAHDGCW